MTLSNPDRHVSVNILLWTHTCDMHESCLANKRSHLIGIFSRDTEEGGVVSNAQMREAVKIAQLLWLRRRFEERLFRLSKSKAIDETTMRRHGHMTSRLLPLMVPVLTCLRSVRLLSLSRWI